MCYYDVHCTECGKQIKANKMAINIDNLIQEYCRLREDAAETSWMKKIGNMYEDVHIGMYCRWEQLDSLGEKCTNSSLELTCQEILDFLESQHNVSIIEKSHSSPIVWSDDPDDPDEYDKISNIAVKKLSEELIIETVKIEKKQEAIRNLLNYLFDYKDKIVLACSLSWTENLDDQGNKFYSGCEVTYDTAKKNTKSYQMVCPKCGKELGKEAGLYKEYVVIMIGSAGVGKTAYLAAIVDCLKSKKLKNISIISLIDDRIENFSKNILAQYRAGITITKTNITDMNSISLFAIHCKIIDKDKHILIKFVDIPGEAWDGDNDFLLNKRSICQYASAFWMCIEPRQLGIQTDLPYAMENEKTEDIVNENLKNVIANILDKLDKLMNRKLMEETPLAIILTKSDIVKETNNNQEKKRLFRPELSEKKIEETELEKMLLSGNNIRYGRFKGFEDHVAYYISDHKLKDSFSAFKKKNYFAVAAVGRTLEAENKENKTCNPSMVEVPFLWLLANWGYLGVVRNKVRKKTGILEKWRPFHKKDIIDEVPCDIGEIYIR